jgi:hypothetical protein
MGAPTAQATGALSKMGAVTTQADGALSKMGAVTTQATSQTKGLTGGLSMASAELAVATGGLSLFVEAAGVAVLGLGALVLAGAAFAISANQAKQAMLSMFDAMGGGLVTGAQVDDMLSGLSDRIGISKDRLASYTQAFLKMGVTGVEQLEKLTLAAISAEAITKGGGAAFEDLQKKIALAVETGQGFKLGTKQLLQLREAGVGVSDIAAKMGLTTEALTASLAAGSVDAKKFGDAMTDAIIKKGAKPLDRLGSSFASIRDKFMQDIGDMFEDIDVGPFMKEVKDLFAIFGQGKASGESLKAGIGGFFKQVFALATKVVPLVKHFLLDMVIFGLQAYLAIKPIVGKLQELWKANDGAGKMLAAWELLKPVLIATGIVIAVLVGLFIALWAVGILVGAAIWGLAALIAGFVLQAGQSLIDWASGAATAALNFIAGLVKGITEGAGMVVNAVKGVAGSAVGAFKSALGIGSPSKIMMGLGVNTGEGFAGGLEGAAPSVHGAASGVASAAVEGASSAGDKATGVSAKAGAQITVNVQIDGAGKSAEGITEELVSLVFERYALAAGV